MVICRSWLAACIGSREPCTSVDRAYVPISEPEELRSRHDEEAAMAMIIAPPTEQLDEYDLSHESSTSRRQCS